jgi:serine/threonine protein kinase
LFEIPSALSVVWLCGMADALHFIYSKQVKHTDVKAENFLVFHMFRIKLCDVLVCRKYKIYRTVGQKTD